jgi:hypothetical protein
MPTPTLVGAQPQCCSLVAPRAGAELVEAMVGALAGLLRANGAEEEVVSSK